MCVFRTCSLLGLGLSALLLASCATATSSPGADAPLLQPQPFVPATMGEMGKSFWSAYTRRVDVIADRREYLADVVNGQFLVMFFDQFKDGSALSIHLELKDAKSGRVLEKQTVTPVSSPKLPVLVPTIRLKPGAYELAAALVDADGKTIAQAATQFVRSAKRDKVASFPRHGVAIHVHPQSHVPDAVWPITTGVPMPKGAFMDTSELALLENGKPVPAQFIPRATWSPQGDVKWVGVDFLAKYDGGKPREYRLVRKKSKGDSAVLATQSDDKIVVNTGAIEFELNRTKFAGIEKATVGGQLVVNGTGGSFIVDDKGTRYDSASSTNVVVTIEENGPLQTSIAAKGWYMNAAGEPLCKFVVRFKAHKGQPFVSISHRMINTIADRYVPTKLADVGFEVVPNGGVPKWSFGFDGKSLDGAATKAKSVFLHQDRGNRLRLMADETRLADGKRSDGWATAQAGNGSVTVFLRDAWQKFPKEFEFDLAGTPKLVTHFWPKHGHVAFTEAEELARDQIYKVRWAHQGKLLSFPIPENYHNVLVELDKTENWTAGGGELIIVDPKNNLTKVQYASGQGTVIGNELVLWFDATPVTSAETLARARLIQQSPHAMADAAWNCATGALGPIAPRDPGKFGPAEELLDGAYEFYRRAIIEAGDEAGMWIYGGVHSSWEATKNQADMKRVWQQSHYQNVFQAWMLYYRSGLPEHFEWARMHSNQHLDVGVCNHRQYLPGTHSYSHIGEMGGDIYHCKGFMPWAGNSSTGGHWIDVANYFVRYYLTGDRRGLDMAEQWIGTMTKMGGSNKLSLPSTIEGYRNPDKLAEVEKYRKENKGVKEADLPQWMRAELAKPANFNPREEFVPLGEFVQYYEGTWNPQMMILLDNEAEYLNLPFEHTTSPSLSAFGKHWQHWYHDFSRDPRVIDRIREWMELQKRQNRHGGYEMFAAFLYHATGDASYLKDCVSGAYEDTLNIYDCDGDRYDGFCLAHSNPGAMFLGRLPYFLHAMDAAGLKFERSDAVTSVPSRGGRVDQADKWLAPSRGWSNTGVTVLTRANKPTRIEVSIFGPGSVGNLRGGYQLFYGFPELNAFQKPNAAEELKEKRATTVVRFDSDNCFDDPPELRNYSSLCKGEPMVFPYVERPTHDPAKLEYRLEHGGSAINLPAFFDADAKKPLPQVAVIPRESHWGGKTNQTSFFTVGVMDAYFRPLDEKAVIDLHIRSVVRRYEVPTRVQIWDAKEKSVLDSSVFMAGQREEVKVTLDPAKHPLPWRMRTASSGDNLTSFTGAEELFFARTPEDFGAILPRIRVHGE